MPALAELPPKLNPRAPLLTASQNLFCALVAKGWKKGEAYKRANPNTKQGKDGCSVGASKWLARADIQARITEETAALTSSPVFTGCLERDQKRLILAGWVTDDSLPHEIRLAALREDSALAGHNAPKVSVSLPLPLTMAKGLLERYAQRTPERLTENARGQATPHAVSDVASPHKTFADTSETLSSLHPTEDSQGGGGSPLQGASLISPPLREVGNHLEITSSTPEAHVVAEVIQK